MYKITTTLSNVGELAPGPLHIQNLMGYDLPRDTVELRLDRNWTAYNSASCVEQRIIAMEAAKRNGGV